MNDRGFGNSHMIATIKHKGKREKTCAQLNQLTDSRLTETEKGTIVVLLK